MMYRYATEVLGIGNFSLTDNPLDNDAEFERQFPESNCRQNGVYRSGGKWRYSYDREWNPFDPDEEIKDIDTAITYLDNYYQQVFNSDKS